MTFKTTQLRDAIAYAIVAGATGLIATGAAFAQDAEKKDDAKATTLDRIEVTGSRLKRAEIEGALPVTVIERAQLDASGEVSVADYLRSTNFSSTGQVRPVSNDSFGSGAFADLRGLGSQRTLVLIDGHRAPKAPFAAGAGTDLNAIPMAAVERIEVLTDGASAIYGADAVGGVINIITRKDYNGAQLTVGHSSPKWGPTDEASILFGISGDRGHLVGGFSHNSRAMIYTNSRPWGQSKGASRYGNNYISFDPITGAAVSGVPGASLVPVPGGCTNPNFYISPVNGLCVYNFNAVAADEASYANKSFFSNGEIQINDDWSVYFNTTVANTKSFGRYAPTPGVVVLDPTSPANPHPGAITYLYHRFAAAGNRDDNTDANLYDILLGFRGSLTDKVDVDAGVRYNTYKFANFGENYIVADLALKAINNGTYNIYNPGATPQDVLTGIKTSPHRDAFFTTKEAYANVTFNDLFQMGGGGSSVAVGGEFRKEDYADVYDSLWSTPGAVLGAFGNSSSGAREVSSLYAEWLLPITSTLEADLAGRYEKYSDYGSNFAPKAALRWHPIDSLTLRGSIGRGFVAPTLDILGAKTAFAADTVLDPATCTYWGDIDPTRVGPGKDFPDIASYCNATGGARGIEIDAFREAGANLKAEKTTQWQLGVVWDATNWLNVTLDYWNIKIKDRIAFFSAQELVDIRNGDDSRPFPGAPCSMTRDPNRGGAVDEIHTCYFNEGEIKTDGLDLTLRTNFDFNDWGKISNLLQASWTRSQTIDGLDNRVRIQGFPAIRATMNNTWQRGDWSAGWIVHYIGSNGHGSKYTKFFTTHDLQAALELPWNAKFTLGVNNVTDKMPELIPALNGRPFNFTLYDAYGRSPYFRYEQRF